MRSNSVCPCDTPGRRQIIVATLLTASVFLNLACGGCGSRNRNAALKQTAASNKDQAEASAKAQTTQPQANQPANKVDEFAEERAKGRASAEAEAAAKNKANRKAYEDEVERLKAEHKAQVAKYAADMESHKNVMPVYEKAKAEFLGARKLYVARLFYDSSKEKTKKDMLVEAKKDMGFAQSSFKEILEKFPETQAAKDAKVLLSGGFVAARKKLDEPALPKAPVEPGPLMLPDPPQPVAVVYPPDPAEVAAARARAEAERRAEAARKAEAERQAAAARKAQEERDRPKRNLDRFLKELADAKGDKAISQVSINDHNAKITVRNEWHLVPYQIRLQAAQNLWAIWASIDSPGDLDRARISIVDLNGNEVGGSRFLAGSLIWVRDN